MTGKVIIVERDAMLRDCGVFTGQIQIVDSLMMIGGLGPLQVMDGVSSPDVEHAFIFNTAWDAWRFASKFQPVWDAVHRRFLGHRRWVARRDGDYFPGECKHGADVRNPTISGGRFGTAHEIAIAATADGFEKGRQSALNEMGAAQ